MADNRNLARHVPEPAVGESDIAVKELFTTIAALIIAVVIVCAGAWFLFKDWIKTGPAQAPSPPSRAAPAAGPPLQIFPVQDLAALKAREDKLLNTTEWIDRGAGIARIPIEQAMALLARRAGQQAGPPPENSR